MSISPEFVIAETRAWIDLAVIGLNLCPFAKAVQVKQQIRYVYCDAEDSDALLACLETELAHLAEADPKVLDTSVIVHPQILADFIDFSFFLPKADKLLKRMGLAGEIQIANFHPQYQFADAEADDISNATNRAPYPTLHLIREASIDRAVAAFPEAEAIFERNMQTMADLGEAGWAALQDKIRRAARSGD